MFVLNEWLAIIAPAWAAGTLLALLAAPLGCLVLWQRMAFFSDALAHGTLLGVAIALLWQLPMFVGVVLISASVVTGLMLLDDERLPNDATLAVVSVTLLCGGLLALTHLAQMQGNVLGYLFGNLLEIRWADLPLLASVVIAGLFAMAVTWRQQVQLATHKELAKIGGVYTTRHKLLFMGILAGFCAIALQAVGSLLISGLLVLPALSARLFTHSPAQMLAATAFIAQLGVSVGIWGSVWFDIQTGPAIVLVLAIVFFSTFVGSKLKRR